MAGHSHSSNIKHKKERNDNTKSKLFLKLRKKLEQIIRLEGKITEKSLSLARQNSFSKEKLQQILKKIQEEKKN